ncbi:MAG: hypothetical protein A2315_03985 [Ignavibacteria bacterium RIFOXYB2_FULL_35_12]|nr:MAG: hypothetical protein A2X60_05650 [Ignavibacteria bacterium GWF2_35_20]OGU86593.1 MAG: hypothetical protein A2492_01830 [Ignavibacteria bacterium RIFOXYC12_FULL_35_11]OGU89055.1 MAG: hypothetical protein A3K31_01565 [Ignavibacteria bacterium RIFOXYA12_FULL_35_25]OGU93317.1 MAG: hypothetical protein A2347_07170 [Ignavibacteria bacterium RIFOXYB12_FULL_35_14]OGV00082.1 MAG: hypothetical protein A2455_07120 [Ignavibacteria bacterium RIFOXYC2_FULL_35_16]OGV04617.1 MAG: hypothetical protein 
MIKNNFIFTVLSFLFLTQLTWAQVPATISYQGVLADSEGNILSDGNYDLYFNLYDSFFNGNILWSESQTINLRNGIFNVILGEFVPITLPFDKQYWLGVSIGTDPELTPRIQLTASPYSMISQRVAGGTNVFPNEGNVGIGIKTPAEKLEVAGTIRSTTGGFMFPDGTTQTTAATGTASGNTLDQAYDQGGPGAGRIINANAGPVNIAGTDGLTVTGKVGIGTNAPSDNLEISENKDGFVGMTISNTNTSSNSSEGIYFNNEDGSLAGITLYDDNSVYPSQMHIGNNRPLGSIHFSTQGEKKITLANNGNLGIGTTDPQQKLHVNGLARFDLPTGQINISTPGGNPGIISFVPNGNRRDLVFDNYGIKLVASTSSLAPSNGIRIEENGYVGINMGEFPSNNILTIQQNSPTDPIADDWTTYSSKRWKTNIEPIINAMDMIKRLRGVTYDRKETGKHDIGLIGEEVGEVIPEIVTYEENGIDAKSIDYARIVAVLIEGMKEQQEKINLQQNTMIELQDRITKLENK